MNKSLKYRDYNIVQLPSGRYICQRADYPSVYSLETFDTKKDAGKYILDANYGVPKSQWSKRNPKGQDE